MTKLDHPGRALAEELVARGWSQADLAFVLGCSPKVVNLIVHGRRGVSPAMSKALGHALGLPLDHFAKLQFAYAMAEAGDPNAGISARAVHVAARPRDRARHERLAGVSRVLIAPTWSGDDRSGYVLSFCPFVFGEIAQSGAEWSAIVVCRGDDRYTKRVGAGETPAEARAIVEDAVMALGRAKCDAAE